MEDNSLLTDSGKRKREGTSSGGPLKKQYMNSMASYTEEDQELNKLETSPHILQYQKRSLLIRLEEQKQEIKSLATKIKNLEEKQSQYEHTLSNVNHAWNQLNSDLQLTVSHIEPSNISEIAAIKVPQNETKSFLQLIIESSTSENSIFEQSEIARTLQQRVDDTRKIMLKVVTAIEKERERINHFGNILASDSDSKLNGIREENEALRKDNVYYNKLVDEMQVKYRELAEKHEEVLEENTKVINKVAELEEEMHEFQEKLDLANRKLIKQEMKAREEIEKLKLQLSQATLSPPSSLSSSTTATTNGTSTPIKEPKEDSMNTSATIAATPETIDGELSDIKNLATSRQEIINKMQEERVDLIKELEKWKREATHLSDEQIERTPLYKSLMEQLVRCNHDLEDQRRANDKQLQEFKSYKHSLMQYREKHEAAEVREREDLQKSLRDANTQIALLKGDKEAWRQKYDQREATVPSMKLIQELQTAIASRDSEIHRLKDQLDKTKDELAKLKLTMEPKKTQEKLNDNTNANGELVTLQAKVAEYAALIDEYKAKKKKWEERERELKLIVDTYQTQAKDKRELKDIRLSEKKLQEDNKLLQEQLEKYAKSAEYVKAIEEKHGAELELAKKELSGKLARADKTIKELKTALEAQKQEAEGYLSEIEVIGKAFEEQQEQNARLLQQLSEKEDTLTKSMAEQIKATQIQQVLKEENRLLIEKCEKADEKYKIQEEVLQKAEKKISYLNEQLKKQTEELKLSAPLIEGLKKSQRERETQYGENRLKVERLENEISDMKKDLDDKVEAIARGHNHVVRLQEELGTLKRKLERLTSNNYVDESGLEDELGYYKQKLYCSVCNDKPKSVVIARCFHMFCKPCVQERIQSRSRKCPTCADKFAESDVHNIYFS